MTVKEFFKPTSKKILSLIILLVLISVIGFVPYAINPLSCVGTCTITLGQPLMPFLTLTIKAGTPLPALNILSLIIDLIILYLILCILFYIFRKRKKEIVQPTQEVYTR